MTDIVKNKLKEIEKTAKDFWNVTPEVGQFLNILVRAKKARNILELGTSNGYSAIWLAMAAKETQGKIITIEYFQERINMAVQNFKHCYLNDFITVKQGKILEVLEDVNEKFDFVFIDANKAEYIEYFKAVEKIIGSNGLIVVDNIISHHEKIQDYIAYSSSHPNYDSVFIPMGEGLMLHYKKH